MTADFGPCAPWPVRWTCDISTESPTVTGLAVAAATDIIWALSGRRFGTCSVKLRPCRRTCTDSVFPDGVRPWPGTTWGGSLGYGGWGWINAGCGTCGDTCSCTTLPQVKLPAPVSTITEVRVDGVVLTGTAYKLYDNDLLIRTDGFTWPYCQNLLNDDTQVGTWSVTALYGEDVPDAGQWAIGEFACEYIKASRGEDCRLPRTVTNIARQGVTITMPVITDLLKEGKTGLYFTDFFLAAVNPSGLHRRSKVYSVDDALGRRPT